MVMLTPNMQFVTYMTPGFPAPMFRVMADAMGAELHMEQDRSGPTPDDDPFAAGHYDLGWVCSTSYVGLSLDAVQPSVQLAGVAWVPDDPDNGGRPVYFGDVVVRPDIDITSFADLAGARVGCNDPVSLSGHYALRWAIADHGFAPETFADLRFTGGHHRSLDMLIAGELDAAVVDSVVRLGRQAHDPAVADLRVIDRLGPWPTQPLVARTGLSTVALDTARSGLLAAAEGGELRDLLQASALRRLVEVGSDHYDPVRQRMTALG